MKSSTQFLLAIACQLVAAGLAGAQEKPNILVILTDDLGYSDLGSYGGEINTPALDALASEGVRFTNFNVAPRCSPTRAALMTGHQNHRLGFNVLIGDGGQLNQNHVFLPELLQANDYSTYLSGKWHLGSTSNFGSNGVIPGNDGVDPRVRGFDHAFTFNASGHSADNWTVGQYRLLSDDPSIPAPSARYVNDSNADYNRYNAAGQFTDSGAATPEFYQTDAIGDYTLDFLAQHRAQNTANNTDNPFFAYMAFGAPHFPVEAPKEVTDLYIERYSVGWDAIRADRLERMIELGIVDSDLVLPARSDVPQTKNNSNSSPKSAEPTHQIRAWDTLDPVRQADLVRRMATYAAMVDVVDQNVGRVVADLESSGELDNTIIMFLSDNGGDAEWHEFGRRDNEPARTGSDLEFFGTAVDNGEQQFYGSGWANVSNTPFISYKHYTHEGGVNSPLIVRWGDGLDPSLVGGMVDDLTTVNDIFPTLLSLADIELPEQWTAQNGATYDVDPLHHTIVSFDELLTDGTPVGEREYGIQHEGNRAYQKGDWKLVSSNFAGTNGIGANEWELYNLSDDPLEQNNLAGDPNHADIFDELQTKYGWWAFENGVSNTPPAIDLGSDFNLDGVLDGADIQVFIDNWLRVHSGGGGFGAYTLGDRNFDGVNDLSDWLIIRQEFLDAGAQSALAVFTTTVPEPSALVLSVVGLGAVVVTLRARATSL